MYPNRRSTIISLWYYSAERELLVDLPNVYNYQSFLETDRAGYVIRQWLANNLYDRIR